MRGVGWDWWAKPLNSFFFYLYRPFRSSSIAKHWFLLHNFLLFLLFPTHLKLPLSTPPALCTPSALCSPPSLPTPPALRTPPVLPTSSAPRTPPALLTSSALPFCYLYWRDTFSGSPKPAGFNLHFRRHLKNLTRERIDSKRDCHDHKKRSIFLSVH